MKTILVVDDEPQMAILVRMTLEDPIVRVIHAATETEALETIREETPHVVLLDIALGAEDGLAVLPRFKAEPALSNSPIVMFSVHDSRRHEALRLGADGFIAKPFKTSTLKAVLEPFLS